MKHSGLFRCVALKSVGFLMSWLNVAQPACRAGVCWSRCPDDNLGPDNPFLAVCEPPVVRPVGVYLTSRTLLGSRQSDIICLLMMVVLARVSVCMQEPIMLCLRFDISSTWLATDVGVNCRL